MGIVYKYSIGLGVLCIIFLLFLINLNHYKTQLKQEEIANIQSQNLKADSLYRIKEEAFRSSINSKIDKLNSDIQYLQIQNDILANRLKVRTETYQKQRYKPIKYW